MRKIVVFAVILMIFCVPRAFAAQAYEEVLSEKIRSEGLFDGEKGIIYAGRVEFERQSLLVVSAEGSVLRCAVYDDADGIQLTDIIALDCAEERVCRLVTVKSGGKSYIMFSRGNDDEFYTLENDRFKRSQVRDAYPVTPLAAAENGKITPSVPKNSVTNFLNRLKEESISAYTFPNSVNSLTDAQTSEIKRTLAACADVMSFDVKNYDYDTLFKYVLYTHDNFRILTDIEPYSSVSSSLGYNNVSIVNSGFIDFVMEKIFRVTPEKPPVNSLISRGFCYNDGYYFYTGGFNVYFATEILGLTGVYDLGSNTIFVIFTDIYREGNNETPEYSHAVLQKTGEGYSVLRIGMGAPMPPQPEIREYALFKENVKTAEQNTGAQKNTGVGYDAAFPVLLAVFSVGVVILACAAVVVYKTRRR